MSCRFNLALLSVSVSIVVFTNQITAQQLQNKSLKNSFKGDFLIGTALSGGQINDANKKVLDVVEKEFNAITPENDMKWEKIHPMSDRYFFDVADKYVALGQERGMHIVGHTLVWHSQLASWVKQIKDSDSMIYHIDQHINTIVGRYKGKIDSWDVVNEALNEDGSPRESVFYKVMNGESYIGHAFEQAAKADPNALLIYNDYNLCKPQKRKGAIRIVKNLQEKGIKIDAIGIQAHWGLTEPPIEDIEETIIVYSELGVQVMFTELDISVLLNPWDLVGAAVEQNYAVYENNRKFNPYKKKLPSKVQKKLDDRYEEIFKLFLKHKEKINRVTFWGINNGHSWLNNWPIKGRTNYPLLFDREFKPNSSHQRVIGLKP